MSDIQSLLRQMADRQQVLQAQLGQLAAGVINSSSKSSIEKPDPFKGQANDVCRFLSGFQNWAKKQKDLDSQEKTIRLALSFLQCEAAVWASRYIDKAIKAGQAGSGVAFPFDGKWQTFEQQFKA
ncbi:hypothetical protein K435DRAFT_875977 [Dendrothele bispora CBS 962.96]|uniref:DUF4939 domain-containing protein n=1 Tax=Dendrothele bispora (strain CBS 962.96) TaxID=1314807 RepID=A0A4S8KT91_DENBC|nr:hypothetical protein K435DRAFT_875977 [Dendrothele bispora CBS 962.96]